MQTLHKIYIGFSILVLVFSTSMVRADEVQKIVGTNQIKIEEVVKSQTIVDKSFEETRQLLDEYHDLKRQIEVLQLYTQQLDEQIKNQNTIIADVDSSMSQISMIERQLPALIQRMVDRLDQFVALDAPFHLQERQQRIEQLRANLKLAELSQAEKFRQVLEAYKIEIEYGRKIDSYEDTIVTDGEARKVNILRVGRIALLYQTRDRLSSGLWDRDQRQWLALDNDDYRNAIVKGIRIAKKQSAIELMQLPVGNIEVAP